MKLFVRESKLQETIKQQVKDNVKKLLEEIDPHSRWNKIPWLVVKKEQDDTNTTRREKVQKAFEMWERNPLAESGIEYRVAYILGKGLGYNILNDEIKEKIDRFWKDNEMAITQYELLRTCYVDGELFLRFPELTDNGQVPIFYNIDSKEIAYIAKDPLDNRKPLYYNRQYQKQEYSPIDKVNMSPLPLSAQIIENIPAEEILHFKLGGLLNLSRGRGVLHRVMDYLDEYRAWLKIRMAINKAKSAFAWVFKIAGDDQKSIDDWQTKLNNFARYDKDSNSIDTLPSGQPIVIGKSMEVNVINPAINAASAADDGRQIKLQAAAGMKIPEFMLSDGENANLATTTSQKSPMIRIMESDQEQFRLLFKNVLDKAIGMMVKVGTLKETYELKTVSPEGMEVIEILPPQDFIELTFPEIATTDVAELADPVNKLVTNKVLSRETACTMLGYNWKEESEKIKQEGAAGFVSPQPSDLFSPSAGGLSESLDKDMLKRVQTFREDYQKELRENVQEYQKALIRGDKNARDEFIRRHQEIVNRALVQVSSEGYASTVLKAIK